MQELMMTWIQRYGYVMVAILIAVENIFPPIPSEVILTFGGFLTTLKNAEMNVWGVVIAATVGAVAGAVVLYLLGRCLSAERLERLFDGKAGRVLHLKSGDVRKAQAWFDRRGKYTVFFCRFIPVVRSLISIPAGMAKMQMPLFLLLTTVGTFIWNVVLVNLGAAAGQSWEKIDEYMGLYSKIGAGILLLACLVAVGIFYFRRRKKEKQGAVPPTDSAE